MPPPYASLGTDEHPQVMSCKRNAPSNRFPKQERFSERLLALARIGVGPAGEGERSTASVGRQTLSTHVSEPRTRIGTGGRPSTAKIMGGHDASLTAPCASIGPGPASVPLSRYRPATAGATMGCRGTGMAAKGAAQATPSGRCEKVGESEGKGKDGGEKKVVSQRRPRTSGGSGASRGGVRGGYTTWSGCKATAPSPTLGSRHRFGDFTVRVGGDVAPGPGAYRVPSLFGGTQASSRNRSAPSYSAGGGTDVRPCNRVRVRRADHLRTRSGEGYVYDAGYHDARIIDTRCTYDMPSLIGRRTVTKPSAPMFSIRGREKFGTQKHGLDAGSRAPPKKGTMDPKAAARVARRQRMAEEKAAERVHGAFMDKLLVPCGCSTSNRAASGFDRAFFHDAHSDDVFLFNQPRRFEGVG